MEKNFKTPKGLKIRLDPLFFMQKFHKTDKFYTQEEILNDDKMLASVDTIDVFYQMPAIFTFILSVVCGFIEITHIQYSLVFSIMYILGYIYSVTGNHFLFGQLFLLIGTAYNYNWILPHIVIIILSIATKKVELIFWYILLNVCFFIINNLIFNNIILNYTQKKYGKALNDTELCAFQIFRHMLILPKEEEFKNLISEYLKFDKNMQKDNKSDTIIDN